MNNSDSAKVLASSNVQLRTVDGFVFDPTTDLWVIPSSNDQCSFNFMNLSGATEELRLGVRAACACMLLTIPPVRVMRALSSYRVLIRFITTEQPNRKLNEIGVAEINRFSASLNKHSEYRLGHLKEYLLLWMDTGSYGLSADLCEALPKLNTEHHEVGAAVRTMDPEKGPLTDIEYESVIAEVRRSFAKGDLNLADYTLLVLAFVFGARPLQFAMLKVKDFSETQRTDGSSIFILQVTRLKQGKGIRPRTLFRTRELDPGVGILVRSQCKAVRQWAVQKGIDPVEAPIFPSFDARIASNKSAEIGLEGHLSGKNLCQKLTRLLNKFAVQSHRTGEKLKLFQTRLRRTIGTRAAAEGLSAAVIADLMDQTWVDSSLVYIETRPTMIKRIDKALALEIAPLAQAFAGNLAFTSKDEKGSIIHFSSEECLTPVGRCGKCTFCGLAAPLSCYTCYLFHPWADAPHEVILDRLLAEREELLQISDLRIASINDRTILAVADVVLRCREALGESTQ